MAPAMMSSPASSPPPLDPDSAPLSPEPRILKSRLVAGETLYGLFLLCSSPTLAEITGLAGYNYVVVDMEHGSGGIVEALPCLRALAATRTPAILRLPKLSAAWAKKALDLGPQGLMFPMIESPDAAETSLLLSALAKKFAIFSLSSPRP
ncbi:4-hydroxy-2-oxovalerate aldolase-like [Phoenix dactylifera]|uniref:4-hydroxy-2-oxovalerate aldolase-like n=1 Tax=Phoenix dactylifera TaxID=42345 RepID=A0A8B9AQ98_PHODC|nr:4-hydroxy-2-oxovalerate aldolase-like [Phoenix dactylifera]